MGTEGDMTTATVSVATAKGIAAVQNKEYIVKSPQNYHADLDDVCIFDALC